VTAQDVVVPAGLVIDMSARSTIDRPLYRCSYFVRSAAINAGIPIGILRSAVSSMADELRDKVSSIFGVKAAESTALLELMADSVAALTHLESGTASTLDQIWAYVERDAEPPMALRAAIVGEMFRAVDVSREHISKLYARSSRAAFLRGHPLERALRDIHAVAYGLDTLRPLQHAAGRAALGLDPGIPL
jgi:indole-3-acetate monooxygenase